MSRRHAKNRPGSGQPDKFTTRGKCEKLLRQHLHRRLSLFFGPDLLAAGGRIRRLEPDCDQPRTTRNDIFHALIPLATENAYIMRYTRPRQAVLREPYDGVAANIGFVKTHGNQSRAPDRNTPHLLRAISAQNAFVVDDTSPCQTVRRGPHRPIRVAGGTRLHSNRHEPRTPDNHIVNGHTPPGCSDSISKVSSSPTKRRDGTGR